MGISTTKLPQRVSLHTGPWKAGPGKFPFSEGKPGGLKKLAVFFKARNGFQRNILVGTWKFDEKGWESQLPHLEDL